MTTDHFTVNSLVGQTAQSDLVADAQYIITYWI